MAAKKKSKKKRAKSKRTAGKKAVVRKKVAKKTVAPKMKLAKKKVAPKTVKVRTKAGGRKAASGGKTAGKFKKRVPTKNRSVDAAAFAREEQGARAGEQSGDLQGLSDAENADSESVDELLEEGNALEAEAVGGVEDAEDSDGGEVRTHEVPQDDVPGEYLDEE
jgi:hypothetical protein